MSMPAPRMKPALSNVCEHRNTQTGALCGRPPGRYEWQDDLGRYALCDPHAAKYRTLDLPLVDRLA